MSKRSRAKARGSAAERELLHMFYDNGWGGVRAAGSGSIPLEVPDVIAGHGKRTVAVEAKYCSKDRQYLKDQEVKDLLEFAFRFGCEAWIGVRYTRRGWWFVRATELVSSGKHFVVAYDAVTQSGLSFEELLALPAQD